jgi:hypothetical protein
MRRLLTAAVLCTLALPAGAYAQQDSLAVTAGELGARLRFISSDLLEGRLPGTRGEALTTAYLTAELAEFGVQPGADSGWLQPVDIVTHRANSASPNEARVSGRVTRTLEFGRDFRVASYTAADSVVAGGELVFVGYGIHAPPYRWDDFGAADLRGKVAVMLLGEPAIAGDTAAFNGRRASRYSWYNGKLAELERRGAVGVLLMQASGSLSRAPVTGARRLAAGADSATLRFTGSISDSVLASLLPRGRRLGDLVAAAGRRGFRAVPTGVRLDVRFRTEPVRVLSHNVIGVVPGTDPALRDQHVVLSAHWDAYGIGRPVEGDSIYNGALDDGSGVTLLLALARVFAANPQRRSITFLFTTAEEWGLLGARAFVCGGPVPAARMAANLNVDDGIELFGVKRNASPLGIEHSTLARSVERIAGSMGLAVTPDPYPEQGFFLRADNFPFALAGVPALYMALGTDAEGRPAGYIDAKVEEYLQRHYHRPSDEYDTVVVDLAGAVQFAEFVRDVTIDVANAAERPEWLAGSEFRRVAEGTGCGR